VQPHTSDFLEIANPRAVMENRFRNFSALTQGDVIKLEYNKRNYYLSIIEVKPSQPYKAISIIETDVEVDFAPPLDQKSLPQEIPKETQTPKDIKTQPLPITTSASPSFQAFMGSGFTLSGKGSPVSSGGKGSPVSSGSPFEKQISKKKEDEYDTDSDEESFKPFSGSGQKLKG